MRLEERRLLVGVQTHLETIATAEALAVGHGRPSGESEIAALLEGPGTNLERTFSAFADKFDVDELLALMPAERSTAIRTWRGTLN